MPGAREPSQARTQGACGLSSPDATEDDAWRRVLAFQAPPCLIGRATRLFYECVTTLLGVLGLLVFIALVIALAAMVTAAVVRISPTRDKAKQAAGSSES